MSDSKTFKLVFDKYQTFKVYNVEWDINPEDNPVSPCCVVKVPRDRFALCYDDCDTASVIIDTLEKERGWPVKRYEDMEEVVGEYRIVEEGESDTE